MSKKNRISESKLIKALAELENVAKGDALEDADPEGGLSTEGKPLSDAAPSGRGETTKKSRASASSPFESASSSSSEDSDDDDDDVSSDASSPLMPPKKDKGGKGKKVSKASKSSSRSSSSSDAESDDTEKSFRERAEDDETMRKGLMVNEFLDAMVDQLSLALLHVKESLSKSIREMEARLSASIEERVSKSAGVQRDFDVRMAKAIAAIGNTLHGDLLPMVDMVKALADQPVSAPRGKALLSKGEINQPPWSGASVNADQRLASGSEGDYVEDLRGLSTTAITDWLFKKSATNQLDANVLVAFEADRYDVAMLPAQVRKAIANDLIK